MKITVYNFSKRENSTKLPNVEGVEFDVLLKENTSKYTPSFKIYNQNMLNYNYVKWNELYYYVSDIISIGNNQWQIDCTIDVLASYRSNIASTKCFKTYSSVGYDTDIIDSRLSTVDQQTRKTSSATMYSKSIRYLLSYVTTEPTRGGSGIVCVDSGKAVQIANEISSTSLIDSLVQLQKSLQSCYDSVISCIQLPFDVSSGVTWPIVLGDYNTGLTGGIPEIYKELSVNVNIPWQFNDWRNSAPYTSLLIYLPGYGSIELNPDDFNGKSYINVTLGVSGLDGSGAYIVDGIVKVPVNFGVYMPMNGVAYNPLGTLSGAMSAVGNLASANMFGAISSAFNASLSINSRNTGNGGSYSGGSGYVNPQGFEYNQVVVTTICHNTNVEPNSMTEEQGRPLNAIATITSGYNQCVNASVSCNASDEIKQQINNYLNGGFYYE